MHITTMIKKVKKLAEANGKSYALSRRYSSFFTPWSITVFSKLDRPVTAEGRTFNIAYNKVVARLNEVKR